MLKQYYKEDDFLPLKISPMKYVSSKLNLNCWSISFIWLFKVLSFLKLIDTIPKDRELINNKAFDALSWQCFGKGRQADILLNNPLRILFW